MSDNTAGVGQPAPVFRRPRGRYASASTVSVARSKFEIEETVTRYGASAFASMFQGDKAAIMFEADQRRVRFSLPLPPKEDYRTKLRYGKTVEASDDETAKAWEQACRQRWRALALVVKAKLEAVESGITTFEDEFLAHIVLPDGTTLGEKLRPQLASAYETGKMPSLLSLGPRSNAKP